MRTLMRDEVDQVSGGGGLPIVLGAAGGALAYAGSVAGGNCFSGYGLGAAVATGAAVGLAAALPPIMAAAAAGSAVTVGMNYATSRGYGGGLFSGMGMPGFSSPSPHARMCSGQAGGSD